MAKRESKAVRFQKEDFLDGLLNKNTILVSGLVIAPVVVVANTVQSALALMFVFSAITFFTLMIASFVPRNIVYAIRIILYTLIGAMVYVPVHMLAGTLFPEALKSLGIFAPLLITNSLIVSKTETRFFRKSRSRMFVDILSYIAGFDIVVIIFAFFREIFSTGAIGDRILGIPLTFSALALPFGGFILLGLFAALFRRILTIVRSKD